MSPEEQEHMENHCEGIAILVKQALDLRYRLEQAEARIERATKIRSSNHEALASRVKALEEQLVELAELVPAAAQRPQNFAVDYAQAGEDFTVVTTAQKSPPDGANWKLLKSVREHFGKIGLPLTTTKVPEDKSDGWAFHGPRMLENGYPGFAIVAFDERGNSRFCIYADRVGDRHELIGWFPDMRPISRWLVWQDWMEIERPTHGKPALMELAGYLIRRNHEMRKSPPVATPKQETIPPFPYAGPKRPVADKLQGEIQLCCKQHDFVVRQGQAFCNKCGLGAEDSPHDFEPTGTGYMKCKKCHRLESFVGNYGSMGSGCTGQLPQPVRGTTEKPTASNLQAVHSKEKIIDFFTGREIPPGKTFRRVQGNEPIRYSAYRDSEEYLRAVEKGIEPASMSSHFQTSTATSTCQETCAATGHAMVLRNSKDGGSKLVCSRCGYERGAEAESKPKDDPVKPASLVGPTGKPCQLHSLITLEGLAACAVCGMRFEDFVKAANTATKPA